MISEGINLGGQVLSFRSLSNHSVRTVSCLQSRLDGPFV